MPRHKKTQITLWTENIFAYFSITEWLSYNRIKNSNWQTATVYGTAIETNHFKTLLDKYGIRIKSFPNAS